MAIKLRKLLIGLSNECNDALRHACGPERPLGPYVEELMGKNSQVRKAARDLGLKLPKRLTDGRGKYERQKDTKKGSMGYH